MPSLVTLYAQSVHPLCLLCFLQPLRHNTISLSVTERTFLPLVYLLIYVLLFFNNTIINADFFIPLTVLLFFKVIGFENWTTTDPLARLSVDTSVDYVGEVRILREDEIVSLNRSVHYL